MVKLQCKERKLFLIYGSEAIEYPSGNRLLPHTILKNQFQLVFSSVCKRWNNKAARRQYKNYVDRF